MHSSEGGRAEQEHGQKGGGLLDAEEDDEADEEELCMSSGSGSRTLIDFFKLLFKGFFKLLFKGFEEEEGTTGATSTSTQIFTLFLALLFLMEGFFRIGVGTGASAPDARLA